MKPLYDYGWFVGFAMAGVSYLLMMKSATVAKGDQ
jgi:cytosine/uracil/thiamine/allantoin permease